MQVHVGFHNLSGEKGQHDFFFHLFWNHDIILHRENTSMATAIDKDERVHDCNNGILWPDNKNPKKSSWVQSANYLTTQNSEKKHQTEKENQSLFARKVQFVNGTKHGYLALVNSWGPKTRGFGWILFLKARKGNKVSYKERAKNIIIPLFLFLFFFFKIFPLHKLNGWGNQTFS